MTIGDSSRNRVRHELIPLCNDIARRDVVPLIARQAQLLHEDAETLDRLAAEVIADPADARRLASAPTALARRAVRQWLRRSGATPSTGGRAPRAGAGRDHQPPALADVDRTLAVARGTHEATELRGGHRVRRSHGRLTVQLRRVWLPKGPVP